MRERAQERALHQEAFGVELVLVDLRSARLDRAQVQQLARVVPLVHGLGRVDPLVALEAHELGAGPIGKHLRDLGLADARLTLEQQRPPEPQREEDRRRQPFVGQIVVLPHPGANCLRVLGNRRHVRTVIWSPGYRRLTEGYVSDMTHDVVIRGGTIVDGTGRAGFSGDLAIDGDRIVEIGEVSGARSARSTPTARS